MASLDRVPDELIRQILYFVSPEDNVIGAQLLSRRLNHLANERLLWRYHCRVSFHYWHGQHRLAEKLARPAPEVDWKGLWLTRKRRNARAASLLDGILATKVGRLSKFEEICLMGYDAKDYLIEQCRTPESAEDVLARRYYGSAVLDSIHRGIAVEVWSRYQREPLSSHGLEEALGAFDMFVLHDQPQDLHYISAALDALARDFRGENPGLDDLSTRQKALGLVRWLRLKNLTGMENPERTYRYIRNCFIGHALSDPEHPSLPIISAAIFCSVAGRLGMSAFCCAFPSHVHASVIAPPGQSLDGATQDPGAGMETMYVDPYGSDDEVTLPGLRMRLAEFGWASSSDVFLKASPVPVIVQRTAQNIKTTYVNAQDLREDEPSTSEFKKLRAGHPDLNLDAAFYGAIFAQLLMKRADTPHWDDHLSAFLHRFALTWSEDSWIVKKYLVSLYDTFVESLANPRRRAAWDSVHEVLAMVRNLDERQPTMSRRYTREIHERVLYRIGQVFRHRRYGYVGVINGWASRGATTLPTPHYTASDETEDDGEEEEQAPAHGRRQSLNKTYYTCMRSTVDRLRVAQENIEIITDPAAIPESLFFIAGKFFKRFDKERCVFVSNITEFYPDD